ncbi:hypothetical protein, conserved [Babesia bigemina]|uniref:Uncharacterized protein n=1 Tax=Babesia bigemina TaxID=5866 RepID=A0A061D6M8_BABBI|nr:hypothetical protein, conserved [Babesia bigemina]CDR96336.1 hypothetical protein, conserved [Babesia bigemina]|eukprot:XP_012768522.1 hypothetical protein, conserved [Babesia bigemina]
MVELETSNEHGPEGHRIDAHEAARNVDSTPEYASQGDTARNLNTSATVEASGDGESTPGFAINEQRDAIIREMQLLMQNERMERERVRDMLAKQQKLRIGNPVSPGKEVTTMKLLTIAKEISGRSPAHGKPQLDERRDKRERAYYRNLHRTRAAAPPEDKGYYKQSCADGRDLIRVLDVDQLPLPMLHHMLCYSLVKHMPAEAVLQVISRIAMLRDNNSHVAYQNFLRDIGKIASPICRAEVVALLSRGYQSVSVPFMVDYVRRFGTFSRRFLAKLIQRHAQPQALDFLRYRAGQRQINQILTRPWALFGYVKMLKKSSAKTYMYHNLLARGYVPNETVFDRFHAFGTLDPGMASTILNSEKLLNDTVAFSDHTPKQDASRPSMYDTVLEAQALGLPLEDLVEESAPCKMDGKDDDVALPSRMSTQLVKIQTQLPRHQPPTATTGFHDVDRDLPANRSNITWSTPWGRRRDVFHFRGRRRTQRFITSRQNVHPGPRCWLENVPQRGQATLPQEHTDEQAQGTQKSTQTLGRKASARNARGSYDIVYNIEKVSYVLRLKRGVPFRRAAEVVTVEPEVAGDVQHEHAGSQKNCRPRTIRFLEHISHPLQGRRQRRSSYGHRYMGRFIL